MNAETIEEYRNLAKALLTLMESIQKDANAIVQEIDEHISWMRAKETVLNERLNNHVSFVNDALQAKGLIAETFNRMRERYEKPS